MSDDADDAREGEEARFEAEEEAENESVERLQEAIFELIEDHGWTATDVRQMVAALLRMRKEVCGG